MKRNKFIFSALVCFVVLILSCSKDESQNAILQHGLETRTSTPSIINGMLSFSTYQDFENFVTNLKNLEQDSTTVRNAFATLGIDLNAEPTTNITDYPVCRLTENGISGFTSARRIEEDVINADLNAGGDAFSIIDDVYLKTALNADMSVHIGTRIFKYFDNGGLAIVHNNNWTIYNNIKNVNYSDLKSSEHISVSNQDISEWGDLYNYDANGKISNEKQVAILNGNQNVSESPLVCLIDSNAIKFTVLSNGQMRIELVNGNWDTYTWTFSNNTQTLTGNPIIVPCDGNGRVFLSVYKKDGPVYYCQGAKSFFCNCGEKRTRNDELIRTVNGETWRIQASIWVRSGQVGCSMSYRRKRFGIWVPASNRGVCTDLSGTYKRELTNKSCIDVSANGIKCLGNGTFPTSISFTIPDIDKIFREPNKLTSGHRVNVKGTWFGFGVNGVPRLILD